MNHYFETTNFAHPTSIFNTIHKKHNKINGIKKNPIIIVWNKKLEQKTQIDSQKPFSKFNY